MSVQVRWSYLLFYIFALVLNFRAFGQAEIAKPSPTSEDSFNIHVDVDLVTTDITVTGAATPEFRAEDFVIYDNNLAQPITYFSHDQLPIAIALLIDSSYSIANHLNELQIAALTALGRLKAEDQVALFSFAERVSRLSDVTEDRLQIAKLVSHLTITPGATNIQAALLNASRYLRKVASRRRRAIILISDNCHNHGKFNPDNIQTELLETATTLYSIVTPSPETSSPRCLVTNPALKGISEETGGEATDLQGWMSLKGALERAISRIRMQYTLGFSPADPGERGTYHKLKIRFANENRCPNCGIVGRSGYYSGVTASLALPVPAAVRPSLPDSDQSLVQRIILIAGTSTPDLKEIPFTISATEQLDSSGKRELKLDLRIDPAAIEFPIVKGRRAYKVIAAILGADEKGNVRVCGSWRLEDHLDEKDYSRITKEGIQLSNTIGLEPRNQVLRIVIYDEGSGRISSRLVFGPSGRQHADELIYR
jgi:Ca-activated chloride channel homolog